MESVFRSYKNNFDSSLSNSIQNGLSQHLRNLEKAINKNPERIKQANMSGQEKESLYRLIGSYYGLSLAFISYASIAEQINWKHWEEEVFA